MKRLAQSTVAVAFGALIVTASVIGGVMLANPNLQTVNDAANHAGFGTAEAASFWSVAEKMAATAGGLSVSGLFDDSSVDEDELSQLDSLETKKELHSLAGTQQQNNENHLTSLENYLQDTETIAKLEGKNAYIRALNDGASEASARSAAKQAVSAYYAKKQQQLIASWNTSLTVAQNADQTAINDSNIASDFVSISHTYDDSAGGLTFSTATETLVNSSTETVMEVETSTGGAYPPAPFQLSDGNESSTVNGGSASGDPTTYYGLEVDAPNSNFNEIVFVEFQRYADAWSEVQTQNTQVQNEMDTFVDNTYSSYVQGQINETDLVDPYLGAREYSPETGFQTWALSSTLSLGLDGPENLSNVGKMTVTDHSTDLTYEGIVLTDENPDGGLTVGSTYNASVLNGTQMVVTSSTTRELTGQFTLDNATTSNGTVYQVNESVTYKTVNYNTTNTSEYQDLMQQLSELQAELNAKQQQERNAGGGGLLPDFNFGGIGAPAGLLVVAGAAVFLLGRN